MIELLVTLMIMSVGMLGVAGLFTKSLQAGRAALFHQQALLLASDAAERIRANPRAGIAYQGVRGGAGCLSEFALCDASSMAAHDIVQWQRQAEGRLPGGRVDIAYDDSSSPPNYSISVSWSEPGAQFPPGLAILIPVRPD